MCLVTQTNGIKQKKMFINQMILLIRWGAN